MTASRTSRRQRQVRHLYECGPRPVFEALLAVSNGQDLDFVLEDFCRLQPDIYHKLGADELPFEHVGVIDEGRR